MFYSHRTHIPISHKHAIFVSTLCVVVVCVCADQNRLDEHIPESRVHTIVHAYMVVDWVNRVLNYVVFNFVETNAIQQYIH